MKLAVLLVIVIMAAFTALGVACAAWIGLRGHPQPDPYARPFGDQPYRGDPLRRSFLVSESEGVALRSDAGGGGYSIPSGLTAARTFFQRMLSIAGARR
ncbi:hypothetical protein [Mesorhizobium sp.]|uniref:hypothetical protein n=1 Tax=Mesorhizobium sp. TaxID=1871066 RepID=UPI0025E4B552|nr:hypothetical protein [Mesorhizobium sp.]